MSSETNARNALVETHLGLADSLVSCLLRRFGGRRIDGLERDDLIQEGRLGLIHAADTFDAKHGADFRTWATTCITSRLRDTLRRAKASGNCVPLDDNLAAPDAMNDAEDRVCVGQLMARLSPRQRQAVQLHHLESLTKTETAQRMNVSGARAGQILKAAMSSMRAAAPPLTS